MASVMKIAQIDIAVKIVNHKDSKLKDPAKRPPETNMKFHKTAPYRIVSIILVRASFFNNTNNAREPGKNKSDIRIKSTSSMKKELFPRGCRNQIFSRARKHSY